MKTKAEQKDYIVYTVGGKPTTVWYHDRENERIRLHGYWDTDENGNRKLMEVPKKTRAMHINSIDRLGKVLGIDRKHLKYMSKGDLFLKML